MKFDGAITAISMDHTNNEGIVGTNNGSLYYINFEEKYSWKGNSIHCDKKKKKKKRGSTVCIIKRFRLKSNCS